MSANIMIINRLSVYGCGGRAGSCVVMASLAWSVCRRAGPAVAQYGRYTDTAATTLTRSRPSGVTAAWPRTPPPRRTDCHNEMSVQQSLAAAAAAAAAALAAINNDIYRSFLHSAMLQWFQTILQFYRKGREAN